jgi:hypothetical protein
MPAMPPEEISDHTGEEPELGGGLQAQAALNALTYTQAEGDVLVRGELDGAACHGSEREATVTLHDSLAAIARQGCAVDRLRLAADHIPHEPHHCGHPLACKGAAGVEAHRLTGCAGGQDQAAALEVCLHCRPERVLGFSPAREGSCRALLLIGLRSRLDSGTRNQLGSMKTEKLADAVLLD